jgi:2-isopropylmalate synthase
VQVEHREDGSVISEATVKVRVRGERVIATAEGNGPVNALDEALRVALSRHYPELKSFELADFKVRILEGSHGSNAITRVLVETSDGARDWTTVGVHENVVEASWKALTDALTFGLARTAAAASSTAA